MLLEDGYADLLIRKQMPAWKRVLNVQAPYRWNLRRLKPGRMLEVGCGIGRNLAHVPDSVGVDPNEACVQVAQRRGLSAFTPDTLKEPPESFDSLLVAHVLEHLTVEQVDDLFATYLPYLKPGGRVILMTPQELGYTTDDTHIWFIDFAAMAGIVEKQGLTMERTFSFPFPRWAGRLFTYNEFIAVARKPG